VLVVSIWEQRAARNEALFREVNENIARLEERHAPTSTEPAFICECANERCTEQFAVALDIYQRVRGASRRFFVLPGHQDPQLERVVETHHAYLIIEKTGEAGEIAERTQ